VIDKNSEASLVELKPITGRKHQLRKQFYAIGQPIFGDKKYKLSNSIKGLNKNLMLHSYQIRFIINGVKHTYTALLPDYFKKLLKVKRLNFSNLK
jgi:Pseudouridylate synthases, 23S RNA-specific